MREIHISSTQQRDVHAALRIANIQLGEGYIHPCDLQRERGVSLVAKISEELVGFCIGSVITEFELYEKLPQLKSTNINAFESELLFGLVNSIAVDAPSKNFGVGNELMKQCVFELAASNVQIVFMIGWRSREGVNIRSLANRNGFVELLTVPHYWHDDSLIHQYQCPTCGCPPCNCAAVIFYKDYRTQKTS